MSFRSKNEDRLSSLPEEVLSHILSLMPTKFAVRSCILSKRWKQIWMMVTNLDFNDFQYISDLEWYLKFVDRTLELCKIPQVKLFRLRFARYVMPKSSVSKWIDKAVRLNVCELEVNVQQFDLPLSLFTCKTLTKLKIIGSNNVWQDFIFPSLVMLPSLKTLDFIVNRKASVNAFRLINGCPMLESLSLVINDYNDKEEVYCNFNIPTLKRLQLTTSGYRSIYKVVLNVPNLEYLGVSGDLCALFVIEDLSSLVEATVSFSRGELRFNHLNATELLKGISGAKSISWSIPYLDVVLQSPLPKFPNLKHLELKGSFGSPWLLVFQHLDSSSQLQHLSFQEPEGSCWIEPQSVPSWMLTNLRTLKITRCKGRNCDLRFIEYMLGNAEVLKNLTITCESLLMRDEMRLCARLLTFPRTSRFCQIHFVGKWLNSLRN
ncbi:hypothetical protein Lser_V15G15556 [Lactuca serriola]